MSEWLHQFISTVKKDKKRSLLIMVLAGVLILVIAWPVSEKTPPMPMPGRMVVIVRRPPAGRPVMHPGMML